jgi:diguanylate cyclase (GGDEF)-like protein
MKENQADKKVFKRTIISFILTAVLCAIVGATSVRNKMNAESLQMEQLILEHSQKISDVISRQLYKTEALAALVIQGDGIVHNFRETSAVIIANEPAIANVLLAPDGIVSDVYPLEGNNAVIGLNYFNESEFAGNKEAALARDTGRLVMAGPFVLRRGILGLVGRYPVFIHTETEGRKFWGLVSVSLMFPEALEDAGLSTLEYKGFSYELWRINPDTDEKQVIATNDKYSSSNVFFVEKPIKILNAEWHFRIFPIRAWYEHPESWFFILGGICICVLVAFLVQNNSELNILKTGFERLSQTDALTGIHNRRFFMESAAAQIERVKRTGSGAFIILFDLDHFKKINDHFGHAAGDDVLKDVVLRVRNVLRPYDLFSRYGGEEFIILITDIDKHDVQGLAERIRLSIADKPIASKDVQIPVTTSLGISSVLLEDRIDKTIELADKALYAAKDGGRNRVVFYELVL